MFAVPAADEVTTPVALTLATDGLLLLQVPPEVVSARVVVPPLQTEVVPEIGATVGAAFTTSAKITVVAQPVPTV
jgi:hypothetical protein